MCIVLVLLLAYDTKYIWYNRLKNFIDYETEDTVDEEY